MLNAVLCRVFIDFRMHMVRLPVSMHCQLDGRSVKMRTVARIMSIILHGPHSGNDHQRESNSIIYSNPCIKMRFVIALCRIGFSAKPINQFQLIISHRSHMVSASDIDTAATEFDRRFHISVDETEDHGNQVRSIWDKTSQSHGMHQFPILFEFFSGLGMQMKMRMNFYLHV